MVVINSTGILCLQAVLRGHNIVQCHRECHSRSSYVSSLLHSASDHVGAVSDVRAVCFSDRPAGRAEEGQQWGQGGYSMVGG